MLLWIVALLLLTALAVYGAMRTFKNWFYRKLGPARFEGRNTAKAKEERGTLVWAVILAVIVPLLTWEGIEAWQEILGLDRTTGVVQEISVSQRTGRRHKRFYSPVVKFSYAFAGRRYQGDRVSNVRISERSEAAARQSLGGLEVGKPVGVYVPRAHPESAFLIKRMRVAYGVPIAVGVLAILLVVNAKQARLVFLGMLEDWRANSRHAGRVTRSD